MTFYDPDSVQRVREAREVFERRRDELVSAMIQLDPAFREGLPARVMELLTGAQQARATWLAAADVLKASADAGEQESARGAL